MAGKTTKAFKFPYKIKAFDELPEEYRGVGETLYEKDEEEGSFIFQGFDDSEHKKKVNEFRDTNRKYFNELKELKENLKKYEPLGEDFNPEQYTEMKKIWEDSKKQKEKKFLDEGQFEEVFKTRTAEKDAAHAKRVEALERQLRQTSEEREGYKSKLDLYEIDGLTSRVVSKVGVPKKGAMPRLIDFGRKVWKRNKEGQLQPFHPDTMEIWYGEKSQPLSEEEFGVKLLEECGFMFEPGSGGGSKGGSGEEGVHERGNVKYIDRTDVKLMAKYAKEILAGTVVPQ